MTDTEAQPKESDIDVEAYYQSTLANLAQALIEALSVSQATRGIPSRTGRQYWASMLLARMCGLGISLQKILPGSASNKTGGNWDSTGALALCRSVFEAHLAMFYLCTDEMSDADYDLRIQLAFLHDSQERPRIIGKFGGDNDDAIDRKFYESEATRLREEISKNDVFLALPEWKRKELLKGKTPFYLSQDELLQRQGADPAVLRGIWELLSSHVHSYPFSFYRTFMHKDRGTGRENDVDKSFCGLSGEQTAIMLQRASEDMRTLFPEVTQFPRCVVDWDTTTCYPVVDDSGFVMVMSSPRQSKQLPYGYAPPRK